MRVYIVVLTILYPSICFSQTLKQTNESFGCQTEWRYLTLNHTIRAKVIFDDRLSVGCGIFSVASTTLVIKSDGDTIRVLQLCNTTTKFKKGSIVKIVPATIPSFRIDMIPYDPKACQIKEAYFGLIEQR